ncbi:MAG: non-canonical purine NTP diphosphatase [Flavobacteriaceae bacterium]|nr:non-canonical purine NTP diphosphatase [Flavobacteriaceae bacterium]
MQLVFATHNLHKFKEVQILLPKHIQLLSLHDIDCHEDIPETAETIEENAILKAEYVKSHFGYDCFADDTGLEVKALHGAPGVYSARYAGEAKNPEANIQKLLKEMEGVVHRDARFKTAIALTLLGRQNLFLGICEGAITTSPHGEKGFGYDPVFQPNGFQKTFAEMSLTQKSEIGHRGKAMRELIQYLSLNNS